MIHSLYIKGFANFLKIQFSQYDFKILRYISAVFYRNRVRHVNFLEKEKKRLKREANAAKKAEKEAAKQAGEAKKRNAPPPPPPPPPTHTYSFRARNKIAQYTK